MPEQDHPPRHLATGRGRHGGHGRPPGRRPVPHPRIAAVAGVALVLAATGAGIGSALSAGGPRAEAPTTTAAPAAPPPAPPKAATAPPATAPPPPVAGADGTLELGERGKPVTALQARLSELGYWLGEADGSYGQHTRQAVMAFQKVEGLQRDGVAGPGTRQRLATAGRPVPRGGSGVEIDLERQVILLVDGGRVRWALNTSTGSGEGYTGAAGREARAVTPAGSFRVQREIDGLREAPLGTLYRPKYFHGGIAVHGSGSVPAHPASHGCARVTNSAMDMIWSSGAMAIGTPVTVY